MKVTRVAIGMALVLTALGQAPAADNDPPEVIARIAVPSIPVSMAVNELSGRVYVRILHEDALMVIDGHSTDVLAAVGTCGAGPVAVNELINRVYTMCPGIVLQVIDGDTHSIVDTVPLDITDAVPLDSGPPYPGPITVNQLSRRLYVSMGSWETWLMAAVDGDSHETLATLWWAWRPVINRLTNAVYAEARGDKIQVIDGENHETLAWIEVPSECEMPGVDCHYGPSAIDEFGGKLYRMFNSNWYHVNIWGIPVVDTTTHTQTDLLFLGSSLEHVTRSFSIDIDPAAGRVFVTESEDPNVLWVVDVHDDDYEATTIDLGAEIRDLVVNPLTGRAYATLDDPDHTLLAIDGESKTVAGQVALSARVWRMALDRLLGRVFVGTESEMIVIQDLDSGIRPVDRLYDLVLDLMGADHGLVERLQVAISVLEDGSRGNGADAFTHLQAFIAEVEAQRGNQLPEARADVLVEECQQVIDQMLLALQ
jgi:DNA-binding beta-propeller fold protein YncE